MSQPVADEAAAVSTATGQVLQHLEDAAVYFKAAGMHQRQSQMEAAIDRLIVLDVGDQPKPAYVCAKCFLPADVTAADRSKAKATALRDAAADMFAIGDDDMVSAAKWLKQRADELELP